MKRLAFLTAALAAAVLVLAGLTLPPARIVVPATWADETVPGILHVHTIASDGRGTPDEVAAAAARAGLKFVVLTDHGDATRPPDAPTYRAGVLCLDGVEISTTGGHYAAIDMPASPYPLGGEPRDVVEDVRRLGGFGIVAHPNSPKASLRWRDWSAPMDAIETTNLDTSWRQWVAAPSWRPKLALADALITYPFRSSETIARLLPSGLTDEASTAAELARRRRVVTLAGADAHAKLALWTVEPGDNRSSLPLPGYEAAFGTLSVHVRPDRPLTGDAATDGRLLLRAIRSGHLYTAVDAIASPPAFEFTATNQRGTVRHGDELGGGGPVTLRVRSNAPSTFTSTIWDGTSAVSTNHHEQDYKVEVPGGPAVYWVSIAATDRSRPVTWIASNPIYLRDPLSAVRPSSRGAATRVDGLFDGRSGGGWRLEHDEVSVGALDVPAGLSGRELRLRYGLAAGEAAGQFVAMVFDTPGGVASGDRLAVTMRAERPMRVSVQLRAPGPGDLADRWQRSAYVDVFDQERTVFFDEFVPIGDTSAAPRLGDVRSLLFVVDTTNSKPGSSGRVWITRATLQR